MRLVKVKRHVSRIFSSVVFLSLLLVSFQNCVGVGESSNENPSIDSTGTPPPVTGGTCPVANSNTAPTITSITQNGTARNSTTIDIGIAPNGGGSGAQQQFVVAYNSNDNSSAISQVSCSNPNGSGLTINCNSPATPVRQGTFNLSIQHNAQSGLECVDGPITINIRVRDSIVDGANRLVAGCQGLDRDSQNVQFTINRRNACAPTQRLVSETPISEGQMGTAVAIQGDVAVSVANREPNNIGAIFVYRRNSSGSWLETQKITPSGAISGDYLTSVALSPNTNFIAVGSISANGGNGRVWVYNLSSGNYVLNGNISGTVSRFGQAIALSNTQMVVGAPRAVDNGVSTGLAYLYSLSSLSTAPQILKPAGSVLDRSRFGHSVAISSSYVVVSAPFADGNDVHAEKVYIFNSSNINDRREIANPVADGKHNFGFSVALDGANLVIGAPGFNNSIGRAFLYNIPASGAISSALVTYNQGGVGQNPTADRYGASVAISGTRVVIGAPDKLENGLKFGYAFLYSTANNTLTRFFRPPVDFRDASSFSHALSLSGQRLAVSALNHNVNFINNAGALFIMDIP